MDNRTLKIDAATHDLLLDDGGNFEMITGDDTTAQCVRLTLEVFKEQFFLDLDHGTDYAKIMALSPENAEIEAIMREAIHQEPEVQYIEQLTVQQDGRIVTTDFQARLKSGQTINAEVSAE